MHAPSLKPALSLVTLFCLFLNLLLSSCTGKLEFAAGTAASAGVEHRQALPEPEHTAHSPAAIPWGQLGARVAEQNPAMAGSVEPVQGGALLTSPVQRLEGTVTLQGLRIASTAEGREGGFALQAVRLGRDDVMAPVSDGLSVEIDSSLARLIRTDVTEEFSTSADGIRQDFLLHAPPAGKGQVRLELALSGATVEPSPHGARIILTESSRVLAYHRLLVLDALDRELPARMEVASPTLLALKVDDTDAAYPIRIDPTFTDENWVSMGTSDDGMNNTVRALAIHGSTVYVGGDFTEAGGKPAAYIAQWDGSKWRPVGPGMDAAVTALTVDSSGNLYAGGDFTGTFDESTEINHIAKWDGNAWSALGTGGNNGVNGTVRALAVSGTTVFVGGDFTQAGEVDHTQHIAKWDGTDWSALGSGMNGFVYALAYDSDTLYAGGGFTKVCNNQPCNWDTQAITVDQIAMWDATDGWSRMGNDTYPGITGTAVYALARDNGYLYIGGSFSQVAGVPASNIALWDGSWSRLGPADHPGMDAAVNDLVLDSDGNLYAGGFFTTAGGDPNIRWIAKWDGTDWSALGSGMNGPVNALAVDSTNNLYASGSFTYADYEVPASRFAKWDPSDGGAWSPVASGLNGYVTALASSGSDIYVGGRFTHVAGMRVNQVAKWDGTNWSALGSGVGGVVSDRVHALAFHSGILYAGGQFFNYIKKWDGTSWSALGGGMDAIVNALAIDSSGNLYAGGHFTTAGGQPANRIAKWDGSWSRLGPADHPGMNAVVIDLVLDSDGNLYAGGDFTTAGGQSANRIAKWDGSSWSALGSGMNSSVHALAIDETGNLYAGGHFSTAGGVTVNSIAKWVGTSWDALGLGVNGGVEVLVVDSMGNLYAGGDFTEAGEISANNVAKWDGSEWSALGSGIDDSVDAMAFDANSNRLYVGGDFTTAGNKDSRYLAYANLPTSTTHTVTPSAGTGGSVSPSTPQTINNGQTATFTVTANPGYLRDDTVAGTCPTGGWSGNDWTTGAIVSDCTVEFSFTASGGTGSLQVTIEPEGARTGGAQWRRTGTATWFNSGHTEADLAVGNYTVEFNTISGYNTPANQSVTIQESQTAQITGTYTPSTGPGSLKWLFQVKDTEDLYVRSSPALSPDGSVVYFGANDGKVYAVNTVDGTKKWESPDTGGPVRSSPAVSELEDILVGSNSNSIYALDKDNGSILSEFDLPESHVWSSIAFFHNPSPPPPIGAFGGGNDGVFYAHGRGEEPDAWPMGWNEDLQSEIIASPAIFNGHVYVATYDGKLHSLNVFNGASKTGFPFQASWHIYSSPAIGADGTIYFATTDGKVYAVNPNGSQKWVRSLGETFVFSSPVLGDTNLYIGCNEGRLHALRMSDGVSQWTRQTDGAIMSTAAIDTNGIIYVGSYDGKLYAVNPNGTVRWTYPTGGPIYASPAIGPDDTIYVGSHDGYFYAIQGEGPLAGTAWPKFRKDAQNTGSIDPVKVVSSEPEHNASGVPIDTQFFTVTFNNPMQPSSSVSSTGGWSLSNDTPTNWSADKRTFTIGRDNAGDPLPLDTEITLTLNPSTHDPNFRDIYDNVVPFDINITFTTGSLP